MFEQLRPEAEAIVAKYEQKRAAMLPVLHLVQAKFGLIPPEAEAWVAALLEVSHAHVHEVVTFYTLLRRAPVGKTHVQVCTNLSCVLKGAEGQLAKISQKLGIQPGETTKDGKFTLSTVECLCACELAPMCQVNDTYVGPLTDEVINRIVSQPEQLTPSSLPFQGAVGRSAAPDTSSAGSPAAADTSSPERTLPARSPAGTVPARSPGLPEPVLSKRFNTKDSHTIETSVRDGIYQQARKAVTEWTPEQIISEVSKAGLRGLGGAGFPTGRKWSFIPRPATAQWAGTSGADPSSTDVAGRGIIPPKPHYLVVNADEGEPGTIKDRYIIERDPHRLLEGMIIAAFATGCKKAYVYIRGEYVRPAQILQQAVDEAYKYGFLGKKIFNSQMDFDVVVHRGAGAYICGEETALLTSLEGGKGFPRLKPPFPAISGLFGCPTVINNVETLACVPAILDKGADWFLKLGYGKTGGTRLFSVSGHVNKPGLYEASHGVTLRELIFDYAGGIPNEQALKAVVPGGISAKILKAHEIDVRMDFDSLLAAGTMAGSAGIIVLDDTVCMLQALLVAAKFFAHESCGQCSPCREGTGWAYRVIQRIAAGQGRPNDLDNLLGIATNMEGKTICVFADAAAWPIQSYITKFRDEFSAHIGKPGADPPRCVKCWGGEFHIREKRCGLVPAPLETVLS